MTDDGKQTIGWRKKYCRQNHWTGTSSWGTETTNRWTACKLTIFTMNSFYWNSFEVLLSPANEDLYYFNPADNNAIVLGPVNVGSDSMVSIFVICSDCGWTTLYVDSIYHQAKHEACKGRVPVSFFAQSSGINVTVQNDTELLFSNIQNNFILLKWRTWYGSAFLFSKISLRPSLSQNTLLIIFEAWKVQNLGFIFFLKVRK